jgi:archaellum component FlaC
VLMHKVGCLEAWAESVAVELVAQEQAHDVQLMRERMDRIENGLDKLATSDGKEVAWWQM